MVSGIFGNKVVPVKPDLVVMGNVCADKPNDKLSYEFQTSPTTRTTTVQEFSTNLEMKKDIGFVSAFSIAVGAVIGLDHLSINILQERYPKINLLMNSTL